MDGHKKYHKWSFGTVTWRPEEKYITRQRHSAERPAQTSLSLERLSTGIVAAIAVVTIVAVGMIAFWIFYVTLDEGEEKPK